MIANVSSLIFVKYPILFLNSTIASASEISMSKFSENSCAEALFIFTGFLSAGEDVVVSGEVFGIVVVYTVVFGTVVVCFGLVSRVLGEVVIAVCSVTGF